jgi:zinc and cadmium transporter
MDTFRSVALASSLACLVTMIGIYVMSKYERWGVEHSTYFMGFAAGVLVSVSFMHIIPKSFQMNDAAPVFLLGCSI